MRVYRGRSSRSGKLGYIDEFISCSETKQRLLADEAERCEVTGKLVVPGLLARCDLTGKRVLPSELEKSSVSGKSALKHCFVSSSISGVRMLQDEGIASATGKYCLPQETRPCVWSGRRCHPEDLRTCELTHIPAHFEFMTTSGGIRFEPLVNLLNGLTRKTDIPESWSRIIGRFFLRESFGIPDHLRAAQSANSRPSRRELPLEGRCDLEQIPVVQAITA